MPRQPDTASGLGHDFARAGLGFAISTAIVSALMLLASML